MHHPLPCDLAQEYQKRLVGSAQVQVGSRAQELLGGLGVRYGVSGALLGWPCPWCSVV